MSDAAVWLALGRRRGDRRSRDPGVAHAAEQALRIESELLRARLKTEETVAHGTRTDPGPRTRAIAGRVRRLARDSLQSNSEVFLQLARERLTRSSSDASQALKERETAIESLVQPIRRGARQDRDPDPIHRARSNRRVSPSSKPRWKYWRAGQNLLSRENAQPGHGPAPARRARTMGRDHAAAPGRIVRNGPPMSISPSSTTATRQRLDSARHDRGTCRSSATSWST